MFRSSERDPKLPTSLPECRRFDFTGCGVDKSNEAVPVVAFGELGETAYCVRKTLTLAFGVARLTTNDGGKFLYRPLHFPCRRRTSSGQTQGLSETRQDGNGRARSGRLSGPNSSHWAREGYAKPGGKNVGRTNHQVSHSSGEAERGTCSRLSQRGRAWHVH